MPTLICPMYERRLDHGNRCRFVSFPVSTDTLPSSLRYVVAEFFSFPVSWRSVTVKHPFCGLIILERTEAKAGVSLL